VPERGKSSGGAAAIMLPAGLKFPLHRRRWSALEEMPGQKTTEDPSIA